MILEEDFSDATLINKALPHLPQLLVIVPKKVRIVKEVISEVTFRLWRCLMLEIQIQIYVHIYHWWEVWTRVWKCSKFHFENLYTDLRMENRKGGEGCRHRQLFPNQSFQGPRSDPNNCCVDRSFALQSLPPCICIDCQRTEQQLLQVAVTMMVIGLLWSLIRALACNPSCRVVNPGILEVFSRIERFSRQDTLFGGEAA